MVSSCQDSRTALLSCRVFNMSAEKVAERTEFLLQFLDLPTKWRLIQNLSGGQQRSVEVNRVGLKISTNEKALFHQRIPLIVQYISKIRKKN